ncbi:MAG: hypothetical protein PVS3B1_01920 [Ktedonobacteraceae bacterium]
MPNESYGVQKSEVTRVLAAIVAEYQAGQSALFEPSYGTARHDFINARMANMQQLRTELQLLIGDKNTANTLFNLQLDGIPDQQTVSLHER